MEVDGRIVHEDGLPVSRVMAWMSGPGGIVEPLRELGAWLSTLSDKARTLLIDQDPLGCVAAAVLHRLFPHARFVLATRHPCEVVLANFMQLSEPDLLSIHFYTIEECARVFERVMRLWQRTRTLLPGLKVCVLRHENLVSDPQGALQPVCEFLGVGWPASLQEALAAPASGAGRSAGLSSRRGPKWWERYRTELSAVLPLLKPVAEKLGYSLG